MSRQAAGFGRGAILVVFALVVGCLLLLRLAGGRQGQAPTRMEARPSDLNPAGSASGARRAPLGWRQRFSMARTNDAVTAEAVVDAQMKRFSRSRRDLAERLAEQKGVVFPADARAFFDALDAGNWPEAQAIYLSIWERRSRTPRRADLDAIWPALIDAYGAAELVASWPATRLLEYGESILGSLRPGMAYAGGTDAGRWIPALLNDDGSGDRHVFLTQNQLADGAYIEYLRLQYGDRIRIPSDEDLRVAYDSYARDARRRMEHDREHPEEPPQVLPGENLIENGGARLTVSGPRAVMAINERIFRGMLDANPGMSFGLEESFPFEGLRSTAFPSGGILEVRAGTEASALTSSQAQETAGRWGSIADQLLGDASAASNESVISAFAHDAAVQAGFLASRGHLSAAEETLNQAMRIHPGNGEVAAILADVLVRQGRKDAAIGMLEGFVQRNPGAASGAVNILNGLRAP